MTRAIGSTADRVRSKTTATRRGLRVRLATFRPCLEALESRLALNAGDLDPTFGYGGVVVTDYDGRSEQANSVVIQSDHKIVAAGFADNKLALARYLENGNLDPDFGVGGGYRASLGEGIATAHALALDGEERLLTAGVSYADKSGYDFSVTRHLTDGRLDPDWNGGHAQIDFQQGTDYAFGLGVQTDSMVVTAGESAGAGASRFALARFSSTGQLDSKFGDSGRVLTEFPQGRASARALAIQADDKAVAVGEAGRSGSRQFALARYNLDGSLDKSFGKTGQITPDFGPGDHFARGGVLQPDGKIIAAGCSRGDFALARYNLDGSLDETFGKGGLVTTDIVQGSFDVVTAVAIQDDGMIVAAGKYSAHGSYVHFAITRYYPDGTLDTKFGYNGRVTTVIGLRHDFAQSVAIQRHDGKIVVAGSSSTVEPLVIDFALARYLPSSDGGYPGSGVGGELDGVFLEEMDTDALWSSPEQVVRTQAVEEKPFLNPSREQGRPLLARRVEELTAHRLISMVNLISIRGQDDFFSSSFTSFAEV